MNPITPGPAIRTRVGRPKRGGRGLAAYGFLAPFLTIFAVFQVIPVALALWQSVHIVGHPGLGVGPATERFSGLENYARALADPEIVESVVRVLVFGLVQVPVMLVIAISLALIFDSTLVAFRRFFQFTAFLPYAIPGIVGALLWAFLYLPGISPVVQALHSQGVPIDFLSRDAVLWSLANIVTWQWTGYNMLIIFAALQALPRDLIEAARVDGAGVLAVSLRIKLPLVRSAVVLTIVTSIIGTLQLFSEPTVLRSITSTVTSKFTPNMAAYYIAFNSNNQNYASAVAVTLAITTFVLSFGFFKLAQRGEER